MCRKLELASRFLREWNCIFHIRELPDSYQSPWYAQIQLRCRFNQLSNYWQSKQYLTLHTVESAHPNASDIFAVAPTNSQVLSASGSSTINIYDTTKADFPVVQTLEKAHSLGIHHLVTARDDKSQRAASAGFEGKVKVWSQDEDGVWSEHGEITGKYN